MKKNSNLTPEQENILFNEATETPGSSELNNEKREGTYHCATVIPNYLNHQQNMKVDQDGHLFINLFQMSLKLKQITISVMLGQNTIVKNVEVIMDIYLMMVHNQQEKDTVIMEFV